MLRVILALAATLAMLSCKSSTEAADSNVRSATVPQRPPDAVVVGGTEVEETPEGTVSSTEVIAVWLQDSLRSQCDVATDNIYFSFDSSVIDPDIKDNKELDDIADCLTTGKLKDTDITIVGYASAPGTPEHNQELSIDRATAVRNYLLGRGVHSSRIHVSALGEYTSPRDPRVKESWAYDRRVELRTGQGS